MRGKKTTKQIDADGIILRMRQVYGVKKDAELADALNLSVSAPSNWRQRNAPPFAICADIACKKGVSLDWLIFGIGGMHLGTREDTEPDTKNQEMSQDRNPAAARISQFVFLWGAARTQNEMIWLEQQFKRAVPEYGEWLANPAIR